MYNYHNLKLSFSEETVKAAQDLRLIDDALFRLVTADISACQEMLQTLLGTKQLKVLKVTPQSTVTSLHREIILDVLCELDDKLINIEVQKGTKNNDIKRTRFHLSSITANSTPKGTEFNAVPNVTIIYITEYDALQNGQVFTELKMCQKIGDTYIPIDDGGIIYYVNTVIKDNTDISELMQLFIQKDSFHSTKFPNISKRINYFKETEEGGKKMCEIIEKLANERIEQKAIENAKIMLLHGDDISYISQITELTPEEICELRNQLNI